MIFLTHYLIKSIFNKVVWIITTTGNGIRKLIKKHNHTNDTNKTILDKEDKNNNTLTQLIQ